MRDWELNQEQFYALLDWLHADRDRAAEKYGLIQLRLVRFFVSRGCIDSEHLADKTINIVALKVKDLGNYVGDRALYFYGVAKFVYLQEVRNRRILPPPPPPPPDPEPEILDACLQRCLAQLPSEDRILVVAYEEEEKQARIRLRKRLAGDLEITVNALRIKIYRLHVRLRKCLEQCLEEVPAH